MPELPAILGTVVLAGINPDGEARPIANGPAVLAAGVDADGAPHIFTIDSAGALVTTGGSTQKADLSADQNVGDGASADLTGCSLALAVGKYFITGQVYITSAEQSTGRLLLKSGSDILTEVAFAMILANIPVSAHLSWYIDLSVAATLKLTLLSSLGALTATKTVSAGTINTHLIAVKVG